jgi:GPH family glycoside/pentoside/hexuronide:cation symporter
VAENTEKLSFSEKLGYGMGDAASNLFFVTFNVFLLYYYTDVFGITAAAVGGMFLITKIFDAVSDPIMGLIADRTNTRWGKFRPYLLFAAIPYGLCGYAMFANPDLSDTGKLIYAYATYSLMMLAYTAINVPYSALMGVISPVSMERTKVASFRFFCAISAGWLVGTFVRPLQQILGGGDDALGFKLTMGIFAVASVVLFWITFATTKERVSPEPMESNTRSDIKVLLSNGPWRALFWAGIFTLVNIAVRQGTQIYYFKYYIGDNGERIFWILDKFSVFASTGTLAMLVGVSLTKMLCEKFEKRQLLIVLSIVNAVGMAAFFVLPADGFILMLAVNMVATIAAGPTPALVWSMYADCADYGEWKTGRRTTGLVFSGIQFSHKLGLAVGAGLAGIILSWFGFVANEVQTDSAMFGIRFLFSIFPAGFALLGVVAIYFYKIDNKMLQQMEQELSASRT